MTSKAMQARDEFMKDDYCDAAGAGTAVPDEIAESVRELGNFSLLFGEEGQLAGGVTCGICCWWGLWEGQNPSQEIFNACSWLHDNNYPDVFVVALNLKTRCGYRFRVLDDGVIEFTSFQEERVN
jgi:hypothetical protein